MLRRLFTFVSLLLLLGFVFSVSGRSEASRRTNEEPDLPAMARLQRDSGGQAIISRHSATGLASFVRLPRDGSLAPTLSAGLSAEAEAMAFLEAYGEVFGVQEPRRQLRLVGTQVNVAGQTQITYSQVHEGVDVFAGVLHVRVDEDKRVTAANGVFIPGIKVSTRPALDATAATAHAVAHVERQVASRETGAGLAGVHSHLYLYREGLVQRVAGDVRLVYEVEVADVAVTVREFVYVDAHTGAIVDQITGIHRELDRKVSEQALASVVWEDSENDPDPIPVDWAAGSAAQIASWQNEIDGARETYNLFASMAGRDSYDGAGATMRTVNNDPRISCPNATWNGVSTNYCDGTTADDVVAHEWAHAYTQHTNGLIYQWQSGALNESYSDIWGETVDLLNGRGTDAPGGPRAAGACSVYGAGSPGTDASYRWLAGEDATAFGGAIRDMWNPVCYGDPGKVTDTDQYVCTTFDNGGVHINSGIPNHAFALMVDGGTYNGQTIAGLGLTKAAHIHWQAQKMLTPASNFMDHADALEAACADLTGVSLPQLSTDSPDAGTSGEVISAVDCQEVARAIAAVELRTEPAFCGHEPLLEPNAPPLCQGLGDVEPILTEDWESGALPAGWTVGTREVANPATFDTPDWSVVGDLPRDANGDYAVFVPDLMAGDCTTDQETGVLFLESPVITIPNDAGIARLAFDHWVATEAGWDGGNVKVSVNGGPWTTVPTTAFDFNTYNSTLEEGISTNPLAGEPAFSGSNEGSLNGTWGQSHLQLLGIAWPGDAVQFRFELGLDACNGLTGWYVDDVQLYACSAEVAPPMIDAAPDAFTATVVSDGTAEETLTIGNRGDEDLIWTIEQQIVAASAPGGQAEQPVRTLLQSGLPQASAQYTTAIPISGEALNSSPPNFTPDAVPPGVTTITHSASTAILNGHSAWCPHPPGNSYLRVFDLESDFDITSTFDVTEVEFGVLAATSGSGEQPVTVNLFTLDGDFVSANVTLIGTTTAMIPDMSFSIVPVPVVGTVGPGEVLVVEIYAPADNNPNQFYIGANDSGETSPSYVLWPSCGTTEPTPFDEIDGLPTIHVVMKVTGQVGDDFLPCTNFGDVPWLDVWPTSGTTAGGSSSEVTLTYDTSGMAAGVYTADLCISSNAHFEPMQQVPVEVTVLARDYDVSVAPDQAQTGLIGETVTYTLQMTNTGTVADTYDLGVSGNAWITEVNPDSVALGPGANAALTITVDVPSGAEAGAVDTAFVTATSQADPAESDAAQLQTTALSPPQYGVALGADQATAVASGEMVTYTVPITNTGDAPDTFALVVSGHVWNTALDAESVTLNAGAAGDIAITVDVPADAADEAIDTALLTATSQSDASKSDSVQLQTTALAGPVTRGVMVGPDQSAIGFVGQTVTYTLQVRNTGEVADTFILSANGNAWPTTLVEETMVLNANALKTLTVVVQVPGDTGEADVDTAVILAVSQGDAQVSDSAALQTTARATLPGPWRSYVPLIYGPS